MINNIIASLLFTLIVLTQYGEGYYWRDWNGVVPSDAFIAGRDDRGIAYVGKAYVPNAGIFVGELFDGQDKIYINSDLSSENASSVSTLELQVLCTDTSDLQWIVASFTNFDEVEDNTSLHIVKGGTDSYLKSIYIGRYSDSVNLHIGSVTKDHFLYYSNVNATNSLWIAYELLVIQIN